jgi:hypothetical protein
MKKQLKRVQKSKVWVYVVNQEDFITLTDATLFFEDGPLPVAIEGQYIYDYTVINGAHIVRVQYGDEA